MTAHYDLYVIPIGDLWRMTATEDGARRPQFVRDFSSREQALQHARTTGAQLAEETPGVTVHVHQEGLQQPVWCSNASG